MTHADKTMTEMLAEAMAKAPKFERASVSASEIDLHPELADLLDSIPAHITSGDLLTHDVDGETVYYFMVGRNASHQFYIGQNAAGTKFYRGSIGESYCLLKDLPAGERYQLPFCGERLWLCDLEAEPEGLSDEEYDKWYYAHTSTLPAELEKRGIVKPDYKAGSDVDWRVYAEAEDRIFREVFAEHNLVMYSPWHWVCSDDPEGVVNGYNGHW